MNRTIVTACGILVIITAWHGMGRAAASPLGETSAMKLGAAGGSFRVWKDASGKFTLEAQLVDFQDGKVRLGKKDAKTIAVDLEKLCPADQRYVDAWTRLKKEYPWLDADAPFDAVAFLAPIYPQDENAAVAYPDALTEFSEVVVASSADEQRRWIEVHRKRNEQYMRFEEAWSRNPKSVDPAELDAWLTEYEPGFQKLAAAQKRPRCAFPCPISVFSLSSHISATRSVARVLTYRNRRDLARSDFERPIQAVETTLRLSRDIRYRGDTVSQLVSLAIDQICCDVMVREILLAPGLQREHCDRLLAALGRHEAEGIDRFLESHRVEYLKTRQLLYEFQHRCGAFDVNELQEKLGVTGPLNFPIGCLSLIFKLDDRERRLAYEKYGRGAVPDSWEFTGRTGQQWQHLTAMTDEDQAKEIHAVNRVYTAILGMQGQTLLARQRACAAPSLLQPLRETCVAIFFEPGFQEIGAYLRAETLLGGTKCLVALRRWQLEHGKLPPDLESLAKSAGMARVPNDPYCDQPLRMATIDGEPVIYSVGPDGKDDGARTIWDGTQGHPGDLIVRLEPPSR